MYIRNFVEEKHKPTAAATQQQHQQHPNCKCLEWCIWFIFVARTLSTFFFSQKKAVEKARKSNVRLKYSMCVRVRMLICKKKRRVRYRNKERTVDDFSPDFIFGRDFTSFTRSTSRIAYVRVCMRASLSISISLPLCA